jgi:AmmeMemoRadiSam system protein A
MEPTRTDMAATISAEGRRALLALARQSIHDHLATGATPAWDDTAPELRRPRATFVTLRDRASGELRGCVGECTARRALAESVIENAVSSATRDPRMTPVSLGELPRLHIEISALTEARPIEPAKVELGRHGLIIVEGPRVGLLLPQVAGHHGLDRDAFLATLCRKAGLPIGAWEHPGVQLLGFEAESWADETAAG